MRTEAHPDRLSIDDATADDATAFGYVVDDAAVRTARHEAARTSRTGELGSEGGSYGELTQATRALLGDNAAGSHSSPVLTIVFAGVAVLLVLLFVWFGASLSEMLAPPR